MKISVFFLLISMTFGLATAGTFEDNSTFVNDSLETRVSLSQAELLVRDMIFSDNPNMSVSAEFSLIELTFEELWSRMGMQVFKITDGVRAYETYLLKGDRVESLGIGFGGFGVTSMCVTDLDSNGEPELTYTYSWGSGIHRSLVSVYSEEWSESRDAIIVYPHGDLILNKFDDQTVFVKATSNFPGYRLQTVVANPSGWQLSDFGLNLVSFGRVTLEEDGGLVRPVIVLDEDLLQEIEDRIWRYEDA